MMKIIKYPFYDVNIVRFTFDFNVQNYCATYWHETPEMFVVALFLTIIDDVLIKCFKL